MMSIKMNYDLAITIAASHPFFGKAACGVDLRPSTQTAALLRRFDLLFRRLSDCTWGLLKRADLHNIADADDLTLSFDFDLIPRSPNFYHVTEQAKSDQGKLKPIVAKGVFSTLTLSGEFILGAKNAKVNLNFVAKKKVWEFILIPKYNTPNVNIMLIEDRNKLSIISLKPVNVPGEIQKAFRFITDKTEDLRSVYDYKIKLWELKTNGNRLLFENIQLPKPEAASIFDKNMITSYIYF